MRTSLGGLQPVEPGWRVVQTAQEREGKGYPLTPLPTPWVPVTASVQPLSPALRPPLSPSPPILLPSKDSLPSLAPSFPYPPISSFSFPSFLPISSVSPQHLLIFPLVIFYSLVPTQTRAAHSPLLEQNVIPPITGVVVVVVGGAEGHAGPAQGLTVPPSASGGRRAVPKDCPSEPRLGLWTGQWPLQVSLGIAASCQSLTLSSYSHPRHLADPTYLHECVNGVWTLGHSMSYMHTCQCLVWVYDLSVYILPISMSVSVWV